MYIEKLPFYVSKLYSPKDDDEGSGGDVDIEDVDDESSTDDKEEDDDDSKEDDDENKEEDEELDEESLKQAKSLFKLLRDGDTREDTLKMLANKAGKKPL